MYSLYEESYLLNRPIECYEYDSEKNEFPVKPHWHYMMEIIYMTKGECIVRVDDVEYTVKTGEMFVFHPKAVHSMFAKGKEQVKFKALKFDINCLSLTSSYAPKLRSIYRSAQKKDLPLVIPDVFTERAQVSEIIDHCIWEINNNKFGYDMVLKTHIYCLLVFLLRYYQYLGFLVDTETYALDDRYDIYSITEYIDAHLSDGIKVNDVADKCGISYSNFAKKFLSVYGKTCKDYIETMRIYKVEEYLRFTDFDLNYISQETGFSDCSHMIKCFKKTHNMTPKKYRNQYALQTNQ